MRIFTCSRAGCAGLTLSLFLGIAGLASAAGPDLTAVDLGTIDRTYTYNLGPTGLRGWLYRDGNNVGDFGTMTGQQPWQILVTAVGTNTPASGILAVDDVILGANEGAGNLPVPVFTNDARKCLGWAVGAAEAGDGTLNLKRWRAGATSDVSIQLQVMGAYSSTAPYDCPKSALILSNACNLIRNKSFGGTPGGPVLGLALLAGGDTNDWPKVRNYALSIATNLALDGRISCDTWGWGYRNVFLSEYYLRTGDTNVLQGINDYTVNLAKGQSLYGTFGHGGAERHADGSLHGSISWYGPVNQAGLIANMSIVLGKKAILASGGALDPEIDPALDRAARFFAYFVGKGGIPYGEHEPGIGHNSNGKDSSSALLFALMGDKPAETEYFTRMAVAGYNGREYGHTGQGFSYLWSALGANVGGTNAVASYLAQVRWHLDLSRRCDGSFVYDGGEQYGGSEVYDYWGDSSYYGIDPTATHVLTYGVAKQQLCITGSNANPGHGLSSAVVSNAIWAGMFSQVCGGYDTNQLMAAMGEYDPVVRSWAAATLGTNAGASVSTLIGMAGSTNSLLREAACQALGVMKNTNALPVLGQRLTDTNIWVRSKAANALKNFGAAALPQLTTMLTAFVTNATDPTVIVWDDPIQISNGYLADTLFQTLGSATIGASTNLLYPAVRAGLNQPDGMARMYLGDFIQNRLTWTHVKAVAPSLVAAIAQRSPADRMFSDVIRYAGLNTLGKFKVEEGIPLCLLVKEQTWHGDDWLPFTLLSTTYRGAAREVLPTLSAWQAHLPQFDADPSIPDDRYANIESKIASTIAAITNDAAPPALACFKSFAAVSAEPPGIVMPASNILLSASAPDLDGGVPRFTWSKISGAGNVSFSPNGTTGSSNSIASFDTPGAYVLQVAIADHSILNSNIWITYTLGYTDFQTYTNSYGAIYSNVAVTVGADTNCAPVARNQSVATALNSPTNVILTATDSNGDALTFGVVAPPGHGALSGTAPNVTYTPAAGYTGLDGFTFTANDGKVNSAVATVTLDVGAAGNRRPAAGNQLVTTAEDTAVAITLAAADAELDPLTYAVVSGPVHGTLSGTAPNLAYLPATNYPGGNFDGADSFTFAASDGSLTSALATVSITVTPVNDPPQAFAQSLSAAANTENPVTLAGLDPEAYPLVYAIASQPAHGTLSGTAPNRIYEPAANYHGPDSFAFTVWDSEGAASAAATIAITVINDPPVAHGQEVEVAPNAAKSIALSGSDNCSDPLTYSIVAPPAHGTLSGTAPALTYTPATNYTGADSFTFKVNDGTSDSPVATVSINVAQWQGWTNIAAGHWSVGANWAGGSAPAAGGGADYLLGFNTSPYTGVSSNNLGTFALNRLNFGSALPDLTLGGNALSFTSNGTVLPQLNQYSANAVTIASPVALAAATSLGGTGAGSVTLGGAVSGAGSLIHNNPGALTLSVSNSFGGGVTMSSGTLVNANRYALGSGPLVLGGGVTLKQDVFEGNTSGGAVSNTVNLSGGYVNVPLAFGGAKDIWLSGSVTGTGGLKVSGDTRALTLVGNNTFSGGVIFQDGNCRLAIGHTNALGTGDLRSEKSTAGAGTLGTTTDLSAGSGVTNSIDIAPNSYLSVSIGSNLKLSGTIKNAGSLVKLGSATLTLSGTNTYSGTTTVNAGTLRLTSTAALGIYTDLYLTNGPATLNLAFTGTGVVHAIYINGTKQPDGVYGASTPPITGTGFLRVGAVPAAVTGLGALGRDGRVDLAWMPASGATGYNVKRALAGGGPYVAIGTAVGTSYADGAVTNGITYFYVVSATNSVGEGTESGPASAQPLAVPAAPTGLAAAATNSWVDLVWDSVTDATGYNVKRSLTSGGTYAVIGTVAAPGFIDGAVTIGTLYYYVVSAVNIAGESLNSIEAGATPVQRSGSIWTNVAPGNWSSGANWAGGAAPPAGGDSTFILKFNATPYAGISSNNLSGAFVLNQFEFGAALPALTNNGNLLQFTANGAIQPLVLHNSPRAVTISNPLTLAASTTLGGSGTGALILAGAISGAGSLIKTNSGALTLSVSNSLSGGVTVNGGTFVNANRHAPGTNTLSLAGGTIFKQDVFEGNTSAGAVPNTIRLSGGSVSVPLAFGGAKDIWLSGSVEGSGGLRLSGDTRALTLVGDNSFSGGVIFQNSNCRLVIGHPSALGTGVLRSEKTVSGSGTFETASDLSDGSGVTNAIDIASNAYFNVSIAHNLQLSGAITNAGSLVKLGAATLTLSGANTYRGRTTVSAGILRLTSPFSLGAGTDVYLATASGSLDLAFTGIVLVHALYINGAQQADGLYSAATPPITGTGFLQVGPPPVPTGLAASPTNAQVNLSWMASPGATGYSVKRALTTGGPYAVIGMAAVTNYPDSTVINGTTYYYVVASTNAAGQSANSSQASATPLADPVVIVPGNAGTTFTFR